MVDALEPFGRVYEEDIERWASMNLEKIDLIVIGFPMTGQDSILTLLRSIRDIPRGRLYGKKISFMFQAIK